MTCNYIKNTVMRLFNCFPFRNYSAIARNKIALAEATIARNSAHGIPIGKLIFPYQSKPTQLLKTQLRTFPSIPSLPSSPIKINPGVPELWSTSKQTTKKLNIYRRPVSELEPRLKSAKNRFQLNTILSGTNHIWAAA